MAAGIAMPGRFQSSWVDDFDATFPMVVGLLNISQEWNGSAGSACVDSSGGPHDGDNLVTRNTFYNVRLRSLVSRIAPVIHSHVTLATGHDLAEIVCPNTIIEVCCSDAAVYN